MSNRGVRRVRYGLSAASLIAVIALGHASLQSVASASEPVEIEEFHELMIVHPSVVDPYLNGGRSHNGGPNDEGGIWSLRRLLKSMVVNHTASGRNDYYASLFEQWLEERVADNGVAIAPRDRALVMRLLLDQFSYPNPNAPTERVYEMWKLPFELIAIAYRPDLRASDGSHAGELRFVYKLIGPDFEDLELTLNMEYGIPIARLNEAPWEARVWAHNFHLLGDLEIGSEEYLQKLERLTWWTVTPSFAQSVPRLLHIRTNELAFAPPEPAPRWQLREFDHVQLAWSTRRIRASSVADTPDASFSGTQALADFIAANPALAAEGTDFMSFPLGDSLEQNGLFLGGISEAGVPWTIPGGDANEPSRAVDNFGLLTCNGCHQDNKPSIPGEHAFYHVKPDISPGEDGLARLSKFLTSEDPQNPQGRPGELKRRQGEMQALLDRPWTPIWIY